MAKNVDSVMAVVVPFAAALTGSALATWRFTQRDQLGGLATGLSGFVLMVVLAIWLDRLSDARR